MKKTLLICITILLSFSFSQAQTDTAKYDLGRLQMDKNLSQTITIKAADLEKMPFTNLSDAINVWLYGVYGGPQAYVPVIDGIVMTDVNALSIYDIDEITLVQNASMVLNGAAPQQLLLLIKTRRNRPGKYGVEAAGQNNIIKLQNDPSIKSYNLYYNQYYLSGYVNTSKINAGLSADIQRDASPSNIQLFGLAYNGYAEAVKRYKFNGYLDVKLGRSSTLSISAGYVPQNGDGSSYDYALLSSGSSTSSTINTLKENLYYNNISLKSSFSGFKNTFTGGYQHLTAKDSTVFTQTVTGGGSYLGLRNTSNSYINDNVLIKDNLSYAFKSGNWEIEPNVNFMYRHYKSDGAQGFEYLYYNNGGGLLSDSATLVSKDLTLKQSLLTPALNINYGKALMFQGGFQVMLSEPEGIHGFKPQRAYPFASAMLNIIALAGKQNSPIGLSIFGSFANANSYMADTYNTISNISRTDSYYFSPATSAVTGPLAGNPYKAFNQWQAGTTLGLFSNKLIFNYTYSAYQVNGISYYYNTGITYLPSGGAVLQHYYSYYMFPNKLLTHRFQLDANLFKSSTFSWNTNLNTSFIKATSSYPAMGNAPATSANLNIVTGGFINRFNYKKAFLGADVLYILQDHAVYSLGTATPKNYHVFNLQNLYAGYTLHIKGIRNLEIYVNARSIAESKQPVLLDASKYYGLGFKLGI